MELKIADYLFLVIVSLIWGATNAYLKKFALESRPVENSAVQEELKIGLFGRLCRNFVTQLRNWKFTLTFILNQSGSVLFYWLLSELPLTIVVPVVNSLTFLFTGAVGIFLGEKKPNLRTCIGAGLIVAGAALCLSRMVLEKANKCSRASRATLGAVGGISKLWMTLLSKTTIVNGDRLIDAVENRPPDQPLVTVANHYSCLDDPMLWCVLPWRVIVLKPFLLRWTLAARDVILKKETYEKFFESGRCIPVDRGKGVYQDAMERCLDVLNSGGWVHMFPEGKVNLTKEAMRLKWGVGRLIVDCRHIPKIVPLHHLGFDDVLPNRKPYIPRIGKRATVVVGEPIDVEDTVVELKKNSATPLQQRLVLTDLIQERMRALRTVAESVHNSSQSIEGGWTPQRDHQ